MFNPGRRIRAAAGASLAILALALLSSPVLAGQKLSNASAFILRNTVQSGGVRSTGGGMVLQQSVGQAGTAFSASAGSKVEPGFMPMAAQPGSVVAITSVTKDTGSLELAWNAPGLNGFFGQVVNGRYRVDTSSDPLHQFRPTRFVTEFATSVVPGDSQSIVLTDLDPNTTYYTRIYLADTRKFFAEDSRRSDESTLTRVPVAPALAGVFGTSVTFSWTVPADGAVGYGINGSSTNFGSLYPGGVVHTSRTIDGVAVTLTITGLSPATTYYFKLASLNWSSEPNFTSIISTCTRPGGPLPIQNLALVGDRFDREVLLSWTNPDFDNPGGVTVLVSTNIITADPVDGTSYPLGYAFADGSVVTDPAAPASHLKSGLELDVTTYFKLYSKTVTASYSVAVSTYVILDLPPMAPPGLWAQTSADGTSIEMRWEGVVSNMDGSSFKAQAAPSAWELDRFSVYRATSIVRAGWTKLTDQPVSASGFTAAVPDPSQVWYYKIESKDAFSDESDDCMAVDTLGNVYAVTSDKITRIQLSPELAKALRSDGNPSGKPLVVRAHERPEDLGGKVVKSVQFDPVTPSAQSVPMKFDSANASVVMHYQTADGDVVGQKFGVQGGEVVKPDTRVAAAAASANLGAYWDNGKDFVKLYGKVDSLRQNVSVQSAMTGVYQIRTLTRAEGFAFDISSRSNKYLTPNGDGLNDSVVFVFDNPKDSGFSGRIFSSDGSHVADMSNGPIPNSLQWDGRAQGRVVSGGMYVYQIRAEDKTFSGSLVVVK
ncbi:MAG: gliding motility-associated C-terminal domain-containing protein [Elusimicrobiota bacterium]|jgi:hypothetical protein